MAKKRTYGPTFSKNGKLPSLWGNKKGGGKRGGKKGGGIKLPKW